MSDHPEPYGETILKRFWDYRHAAFVGMDTLFEVANRNGARPPVFQRDAVTHNVLTLASLKPEQRAQVLRGIPPHKRHRWFRSMRSSQALAQSIFGNLQVAGRLGVLSEVVSDTGDHPFADVQNAELEYSVNFLGEDPRRCTSVDVWLTGKRTIAVECKFSEPDVGTCSRPRLDALEPDYCNGSYSVQHERHSRCSLTEVGIQYWNHIPHVLAWDPERDWSVCPLKSTYQIVRNLLAACGGSDGTVELDRRVTLLVIDQRNPAFQSGGTGRRAFDTVRAALHRPEMLQFVTWQQITSALSTCDQLAPLAESLAQKYGFSTDSTAVPVTVPGRVS